MRWIYGRTYGFVAPLVGAMLLGAILRRWLPDPVVALLMLVLLAAVWYDQGRRLLRGRPPKPAPGFGPTSPRTTLLDGFEDRDDRQIAGPSNDVHDLSPPAPPRVGLSQIAERAPALSLLDARAQLLDLYVGALRARAGDLGAIEPYLSESATERLRQGTEGLDACEVLAVGPASVREAGCDDTWAWMELELRALVEERRGESSRVFEERDRMRVVRRMDAPDGTPWTVQSFPDSRRSPLGRPPADPGRAPEPGGSLESVIAPDLSVRRAAFDAANPGHDWAALEAWLGEVFAACASARAGRPVDPSRLEPSMASGLGFEAAALARVGLRKRVEDPVYHSAELVRLDQDPRYDIATFRVRGAWREWLEEETGELWRGDPGQVRFFTEYWAMARARDARLGGLDRPGQQGWALIDVVDDEDYTG